MYYLLNYFEWVVTKYVTVYVIRVTAVLWYLILLISYIISIYYYITNTATIKYYDYVLRLYYCYITSQFAIL